MTALETVPVVAKQHRTWREQGGPLGRAILKCPLRHEGDAEAVVLLLEWPVARTSAADNIFGTPAYP